MKIRCEHCGNEVEVNKELIGAILSSSVSGFGFFAWTSFLFAGTGFAFAICAAIIVGGPALYTYSSEIIEWLIEKGYKCSECGSKKWKAFEKTKDGLINEKFSDENNDKYKDFLNRIKELSYKIENNKLSKYNLIMLSGSKINELNIFLVNELCSFYNINFEHLDRKPTQSKLIKALENNLSKEITNNLYYINNLRNKIQHPDDYGIDINSLSKDDENFILDECEMCLKKMDYIYKKILLNNS